MQRSIHWLTAFVLCACAPKTTPAEEAPATTAESGAEQEEERELPLDEAVTLEGTGISIRPPRGSERAAVGSTLVHPRRRIQIALWAADGDLSNHQDLRRGLAGDAEQEATEEVEVDGAPGTLVIDRMTQGENDLERVWVVARRGTRSVAAMGVYNADQSRSVRRLVRGSVLSITFDAEAPLDPEAAVGWEVEPPEGLALVRSQSTTVAYAVEGRTPQPGATNPSLFLMPIPVAVPDEQRRELCQEILGQLVHVAEERANHRRAIDAGEVQGCELQAQSEEGPSVTAYFALLFRGESIFMLGGTVPAANARPWLPKFQAAARTLRPHGRSPASNQPTE